MQCKCEPNANVDPNGLEKFAPSSQCFCQSLANAFVPSIRHDSPNVPLGPPFPVLHLSAAHLTSRTSPLPLPPSHQNAIITHIPQTLSSFFPYQQHTSPHLTKKLNKLPPASPPTRHNPIHPPAASLSSSPTNPSSLAPIMQQLPKNPLLTPNPNCTAPR